MPPFVPVLFINLVPALCVVALGWSAFTLVALYWIENLIAGAINALKIVISGAANGWAGILTSLFLTPFFIFHYGMFCAVHGVFIWALFGGVFQGAVAPDGDPLTALPKLLLAQIGHDRFLFWNVALLALYHLFRFAAYWLGNGEWRRGDPFTQMFSPYGRIIVVHMTIMLAGIPVALLGQPVWGVLCLALLKTGLETGRMFVFEASAENAAKARAALKALNEGRMPETE